MNSGLNKKQEEAVNHPGGPLLMAAGAGSGKTRALTGRLKALITRGVPPEEIIAITFTNKAAKQMRERVFGVERAEQKWSPRFPTPGEPFIGTFHSLGARILKQELKSTGRRPGFSIFDDDDSLSIIKTICKDMDLSKEQFRPAAIASRISSLKSELKDASELLESPDSRDVTFLEIFNRYERTLTKNNAFDFDDLIEKPVRIFLEHPDILKKYQTAFSHILVDEYQDINTAQYQLVRLLAQEHKNVSVVGDDFQSIYSFRGADMRNFLNFHKDWPSATIIKLEQNYRSTKNIIAAAGAVIKNNALQTPKELWTDNPAGEKIRIVAAEDPDTESIWIANEIRNIRSKNKEAGIGIIYRTNAQSRALEQALISENISYKIFGGLRFYDRKEVKDVLAALRLASNPDDSMSAERLEKSLGKRASRPVLEQMPGRSSNLQAAELIQLFMNASGYKEFLEAKFNNPQERLENIAELTAYASEFETLEEFLERAALLQSADQPSAKTCGFAKATPDTAVNLMTIHIAKGLEFDYVFVVGVNEGTLPHERSLAQNEDVEEERRLMYVAMTRAREVLYLVFHAFPSRFLYEIPDDLYQFISPNGIMDKLPSEDEMWIEN